MRSLLFVLLLLPATVFAQKNFELSLNGGIVNNNLRNDYDNKRGHSMMAINPGGGISASVGVYKGLRIGLSASAYKVSWKYNGNGIEANKATYSYGNPVVPLELTIVKRMQIGKVSIDMGAVGGLCFNGSKTLHVNGETRSMSSVYDRRWLTLGTMLSAQVPITKNFSLGGEVQVKTMRAGNRTTLLVPVMLKATFHLGK